MSTTVHTVVPLTPSSLPEGYWTAGITGDQEKGVMSVCVLLRKEPDDVGGRLVVLRDTIDGRVYLGCVVDAGGRVHQWLEVWVQDLENLDGTIPACREALSNRVLDERWAGMYEAYGEADEGGVISTGYEKVHPLPTYFKVLSDGVEVVNPKDDETGKRWSLCEDDGLLESNGLAKYSSTLHRYLHVSGDEGQVSFLPVTDGAPSGDRVWSPGEVIEDHGNLIGFNKGGGLLLVRPYSPLGIVDLGDYLGGAGFGGVDHGKTVVDVGLLAEELSEEHEDGSLHKGRLFMGRHGKWGRMIESFHLKLKALADAVDSVRDMVKGIGRPLLNLDERSFCVHLGRSGCGLPFLWSARTVLNHPGDAVTLPIKTSDAQFYLPGHTSKQSIYRPVNVGEPVEGAANIRIRQVLDDSGGTSILEGTFTTQERISPARYDIVWMRLNVGSERVDVYVRLEEDSALAAGEWRFRSVGQRFEEGTLGNIREAEGVPLSDTAFELIPLMSTPCDMYALLVLAVRLLLVDDDTTLAVALDEVMSLAREVAHFNDGEGDVESRVEGIFEGDVRWVESLGPQRLMRDAMSVEEGFDLAPREVWFSTLAMLVRMVPGIGPDSICQDFGDAPPGGIHLVFDRTLRDLERLLIRTRSLIVIDWRFNREVHSVVRGFMTEVL